MPLKLALVVRRNGYRDCRYGASITFESNTSVTKVRSTFLIGCCRFRAHVAGSGRSFVSKVGQESQLCRVREYVVVADHPADMILGTSFSQGGPKVVVSLTRMKILSVLLFSCVVAAGVSNSGPSFAGTQSEKLDTGSVEYSSRSRAIGRREAIRIAERNGIWRVRHANLRGLHWVVTGDTHRRRDVLRLTIDQRTGRVLSRRYIHF